MLAIAGAILIHAACTLRADVDPFIGRAWSAIGGGLIGLDLYGRILDFLKKVRAEKNQPQP